VELLKMKKCTQCEITKELNEFNNNKYAKDGKRPECKECQRAYNKIKRNDIKEIHRKTCEIIIENDIAKIDVLHGVYAIIDKNQIDKIKNNVWCFSNDCVHSRKNGKSIKLHRVIMDAPEGTQIDHINGNSLDNRIINLRLATNTQNQCNRSKTQKILLVIKEYHGINH
jgi:hypothetical protein